MADTSKASLEMQLKVWEGHAVMADQNISRIKNALKAMAVPPAPPLGTKLMVEVQFLNNPNNYEFLIKSVPNKGYYTTGTLPQNAFFGTWSELWAYFNSEDVVRRSEFRVLHESPFPSNRYGGALDRRPEW